MDKVKYYELLWQHGIDNVGYPIMADFVISFLNSLSSLKHELDEEIVLGVMIRCAKARLAHLQSITQNEEHIRIVDEAYHDN